MRERSVAAPAARRVGSGRQVGEGVRVEGHFGGGSCVLYVADYILWLDTTDGTGHLGIALQMPSDTATLGFIGYVQYAVADLSTSLGLVTSNAATMVLGR